jgi:hypothetical protein
MKGRRKTKLKKIFIILIALLLLVSCGDTSTIDTVGNGTTNKADNSSGKSNESEVAYEITYNNHRLYTNSIGTVWLQAIVEVTNTGTVDLYMSSGKFDIEDENGKLIDTEEMVSVYPQIISPGEKAYYNAETTLDNITDDTIIKIVPKIDAEKSKTKKINLAVSEVEISDDKYRGINILGRIENTTDEEQTMLYVVIVCYDVTDNPIAVISTITDALEPGEKTSFKATALSIPDDITAASVASYTALAFPYQFQF